MRLLFASTVPQTLDLFMRGQLSWIAAHGHDVHVVSSPGAPLDALASREGVQAHAIPMVRDISARDDPIALAAWVGLIRRLRPDVTVVSTPKAALLGGISASLLRVPRRVYLMRGARFEGATGRGRDALVAAERLTCSAAHRVIAVSPSLACVALEARVVAPGKLATVGDGSSNGVDVTRFHPPSPDERHLARARWGLGPSDIGVAFVGRLSADKGLDVLREALRGMPRTDSRVVLLLAGPDEGAGLRPPAGDRLAARQLGHVDDVPGLLHACDVLALPTQREGFPNVVLEAAACGLPVVTTDATGAVDSVVDDVTGFVVGRRDGEAFGRALARLADDAALRARLGAAARRRVETAFDQRKVWEGMYREYLGLSRDG